MHRIGFTQAKLAQRIESRMKKKSVAYIKTFKIGTRFPDHLLHYLPRIKQIYHDLFERDETFDISYLLQCRGDNISLGLFFDNEHMLCGFTIAGIQTIHIEGETHALFSAGAYSDLNYKTGNWVVKFALQQSIRYKLKHPYHKLAYLEEALSPAAYSLSSRILPECYPNPNKPSPKKITAIIDAIKTKRDYIMTDHSPWVVKFPIKLKLKDYQRILNAAKRKNCQYYQHYFALNPHFMEGHALLVYMPLTLKNIMLAMKNNLRRVK